MGVRLGTDRTEKYRLQRKVLVFRITYIHAYQQNQRNCLEYPNATDASLPPRQRDLL